MAATLTYVLAPQRIVLGGGVGGGATLLARVHRHLQAELGGYLEHLDDAVAIADYIVHPGLGDRSGVLGAIALATDALVNTPSQRA